MKKAEEILLNKLKANKTKDVPLSNVKNAIGSIRFVKGNPLSKTEIALSITTHFFLGLAEIAPAALPVNLQTALPCFLFGLNDFGGGFSNCYKVLPPINPWILYNPAVAINVSCGVFGYNLLVPAAGIIPFLIRGDMIYFYSSTQPPNTYTAYVIVHCNNVAYGTFLQSLWSDLITIDLLRYIVPVANINQFINPLMFGYQSLFGKLYTDNIDPRMYVTSKDFQQQISDIPLNLPIDKAMFIGFLIDVFCQQINMVLFVKKVEALTHRKSTR